MYSPSVGFYVSMCDIPLCNVTTQTCQAYWPEKVGASKKFGDMEVTLKSEEISSLVYGLTIRELTLTNTAKVIKLLLLGLNFAAMSSRTYPCVRFNSWYGAPGRCQTRC